MDCAQVLEARGNQKMGVPDGGEQTPRVLGHQNPKTLMPQTRREPISGQEVFPGEKGSHEATNTPKRDQNNVPDVAALNRVAECASRMP